MFGMSVFQSVLERLKAENDDMDFAEDGQSTPVRGLNTGFVGNLPSPGPVVETGLSDTGILARTGIIQRAYFDTAGKDMLAPPKPLPEPVIQKLLMPKHLSRIDPQEIVTELSFGETETLATLSEKRRHFAAENHPDRYHLDFRKNATIRMKIANMLIDEAQRRLRLQHGH